MNIPPITIKYKSWLYLLILSLVFAGVYIYTFDSKIAVLGDNAYYYILGKALAEGEGYVNISNINKPPNYHYPPGYPAIIGLTLFLGASTFSIKVLNGIFLLLTIYIFYFLFKKLLNEDIAFIASLMILLNSHILYYSSIMMSEIPFMFFSGLSILLFFKASEKGYNIKDLNFIGALLSMLIAYYIRSLGLAIFAGFFLHFIIKRQWKYLVICFFFLVVGALPWFIRGQHTESSSYLNQLSLINPYQPALGRAGFGDFAERVLENISRYITFEIPSALFPNIDPDYWNDATLGDWVIGSILIGIAILGLISQRKHRWILIGYTLGTFGILMIWPSVWIGVRFIVPFIPILIYTFLNGINEIFQRIASALGQKSLTPLLLLFILLFAWGPIKNLHKTAKADYYPALNNYFKIANWLSKNVKQDAVVSCAKPALLYLKAKTFTMRYKFDQNPGELIQDLEDKQVDYVVLDQFYKNTYKYLIPAIRNYPQRFQKVIELEKPNTYLLKFKEKND
ncbi:glycosyltransferase family 39 protein [Marivirga salinae]|uniref:Glycosyltransferase family 39 protein n=1 Tax=Marivirga salinarum TaxID=3059078 RepID=A0AA51NBT7_9BACT|nr:glycosyltransferase family 39 protein [Marivirga sp. BDSF4-3]WMN12155.1 glycosyltransferase family 39 protein [Marivirga sp. BDSF4-3]